MKKDEIHLWDIQRILFGQAPPEFMLEVFLRSLVVYLIAIAVMRWMGKRMNGQHSIVELSVMIMMGAIISVPMQMPDRGILQGVLVLFTTLFLLRVTNWLGFKSPRFEQLVHGDAVTLVSDGVLQRAVLEKTRITNQQVFEILRSRQIFNLGQVKRMYLEGPGIFSVYQQEPRAGLPIFPQIDETVLEAYPHKRSGEKACTLCGWVQPEPEKACRHCGHDQFTHAIV
ncbi:MAG TPA: YetF domain-containing protein [Chitinophagaceae bacterium]|jgi:uncharacterized membrane protein YcaP (DUF421 family)|nr:YetF domain-containing protein [Chitinophagaceae bacterium]